MYIEFDVESVTTNLSEKSIDVKFTFDVDKDTVSSKNLLLINRETNSLLPCEIKSSSKNVYIVLNDWPDPNTEHMLFIQKDLKSVTGDSLRNSLQRALIFKSAITSVVNITSPSHHEKLSEIKMSWIENVSNENSQLVNSYRIDISENNAFYGIIKSSIVDSRNEIILEDIPNGQYYIRIRAEKDNEYGKWSEIIAFTKSDISEEPEPTYENEDEPIFINELSVIGTPANGETPNTFIIEFDDIIDQSSIEEITITRRNF